MWERLTEWAARSTGCVSAKVTSMLPGSSSATIVELRLRSKHGVDHAAVAKVFDRPQVTGTEASDHVSLEADRLRRVQPIDVPTPEPLAADIDGRENGVPVLLMTRVAGVPQPRWFGPEWTTGLAETLRAISSADVDTSNLPLASSWRDPSLERPSWFGDAALWEAAGQREQELVGSPSRFIHRDFHPLNVLWSEGSVSGIVDWLHACIGRIEHDLAACRVNIALTDGVAAVDAFTKACGDLADGYDRGWDLERILSLAGYPEVLLNGNGTGAGVTLAGIHRTLIDLTRHAIDA
jgi:aminoglycoside phosphotransferase (APT) family kinase protein